MRKSWIAILLIGALLVSVGIIGNVQDEKIDRSGRFVFNKSNVGGNMMRSYNYNRTSYNSEEILDIDILTHEVEKYIENYIIDLEIADIFIFEDSEYYYSIIEKETGKGAMELLVNPYTGHVFPEYGPNMMWNLKYGMHRRGVFSENNELTSEEAYNEGVEYLLKFSDGFTLTDEYHEFYGYYTFHVSGGDETTGMLSVNGFTGAVWYHDWHGELIEIVESHEDEH